jgi:hypothetical protein
MKWHIDEVRVVLKGFAITLMRSASDARRGAYNVRKVERCESLAARLWWAAMRPSRKLETESVFRKTIEPLRKELIPFAIYVDAMVAKVQQASAHRL